MNSLKRTIFGFIEKGTHTENIHRYRKKSCSQVLATCFEYSYANLIVSANV